MAKGRVKSIKPPDIAPEGPTEETKAPATGKELFDCFTGAAHFVTLSLARSGKSGGGERDSEGMETDGPTENTGNIAAGLYSSKALSALLGAVNLEAV